MKLKELILYISSQSIDDPHFGSIKLNKMLFYSDLYAFGILGKSITDTKYLKRPLGPAPRNIKAIQNEMATIDKSIKVEYRPVLNGTQKRVVPTKYPNTDEFTPEEKKLIDQVILFFKEKNAPETSDYSHDFRWETANMDEEIPLETVFLSTRPLTDKENKYALTLTSSKDGALAKGA